MKTHMKDLSAILNRLRVHATRQAKLAEDRHALDEEAGAVIRAWRDAQQVSLRTMAKRLGVSAAHLSDVELGRRHCGPTVRRILKDKPSTQVFFPDILR